MRIGPAGERLFAYTGGRPFDPALPCVVMLHGAQHDHSVWILQSRFLAHHGYSVLALDLPGHGRSEAPLQTTIESIADAVARSLGDLACTPLMLVGHSMGSLVALELSLRLAERVRAVALLAAAFPMRVSEALLAATRDDPPAAMQMINVWSHRPGIASFAVRPGNPGPGFNVVWENLQLMRRIERVNGVNVLPTDFAACNAYRNGLQAAAALRCPALVLCAAGDQMTPPRAAQELIRACPDARTITLAGSGHAMMAEQPDAVRSALAQFAAATLARTPAPAA
jgi:pimeloyl-ACP methyl ester carboxylesterase